MSLRRPVPTPSYKRALYLMSVLQVKCSGREPSCGRCWGGKRTGVSRVVAACRLPFFFLCRVHALCRPAFFFSTVLTVHVAASRAVRTFFGPSPSGFPFFRHAANKGRVEHAGLVFAAPRAPQWFQYSFFIERLDQRSHSTN